MEFYKTIIEEYFIRDALKDLDNLDIEDRAQEPEIHIFALWSCMTGFAIIYPLPYQLILVSIVMTRIRVILHEQGVKYHDSKHTDLVYKTTRAMLDWEGDPPENGCWIELAYHMPPTCHCDIVIPKDSLKGKLLIEPQEAGKQRRRKTEAPRKRKKRDSDD